MRAYVHAATGFCVRAYDDVVVVRNVAGIVVARAVKVDGRRRNWVCPEMPASEAAAMVLAGATTHKTTLGRGWRVAWPRSMLRKRLTCFGGG